MNFFGHFKVFTPCIASSINSTAGCTNWMRQNVRRFHSLYTLQFRKSPKLTIANQMQCRVYCSPRPKLAPPKMNKPVGYWLLGCSGMVFVAVSLGGLTRLTESGLSMVSWKFVGESLPTSHKAWKKEFIKYKQTPEYKYLKMRMSLDEFKRIWLMEYAHRMWGRAIGLVFFVPAIYFWRKGLLDKKLKIGVGIMGALIIFQGLLGWYMVKSGLEDRFHGPSDVPRVSQYRLAAHLSTAFVLYGLMFQSTLNCLVHPQDVFFNWRMFELKQLRMFQSHAWVAAGFVFITAVTGAFVSGLDAGLACSTFPKMNGKWIPDDVLSMFPTRINFTENPITVIFDHRLAAALTTILVLSLYVRSKFQTVPQKANVASFFLFACIVYELYLGAYLVLDQVPLLKSAIHQNVSLLTFTSALWLVHELKRVPR